MSNSFIGIIGLGTMGKNLALNIAEKGFSLSVYNRIVTGEENFVKKFLREQESLKNENVKGFTDLKSFIESLELPRKIILMINAGDAIDKMIEFLIPLLSKKDIIIDAGNSYFKDTNRRFEFLETQDLNFIGMGISGGQKGARKGPSIMVGGKKEIYNTIAPVLETIAAKDFIGGKCCAYIANKGSLHQ